MIFIKDLKKLRQPEKDPWLETSFDLNLDSMDLKQEPQFEFNFANSTSIKDFTEQENIEQFKNLFYNNNNNNNKNVNFNNNLSPKSPWETSNIEIFDEQLLSPASAATVDRTTPPHTLAEEAEDLFDDSDETKIMNFEDYEETPPISFEDDFLKYSKLIEKKEQEMIQSYEGKRPLPESLGAAAMVVTVVSQEDVQMMDIAQFSQATFSSQDPTVNPHMIHGLMVPTVVEETHNNTNINSYKLEHNYTKEDQVEEDKIEEKPLTQIAARTQERRVPKLKLKIPRQVKSVQDYEQKLAVSTPEITNEILDLESQFDLVSYIDSNVTHAEEITSTSPVEEKPHIEILQTQKRKSSITIEELAAEVLRSPKHQYNTRTRASSPCTSTTSDYFNPGSVQSTTSDDSYTTTTNNSTKPTKRRGRPPKPVPSLLDPNEIASLDPQNKHYRELRNKNNEASRRSRLHRKDRETQLEQEASQLEQHHETLAQQVERLTRKCEQWKAAVMKIALLQ